jgi:hypothetical protein
VRIERTAMESSDNAGDVLFQSGVEFGFGDLRRNFTLTL